MSNYVHLIPVWVCEFMLYALNFDNFDVIYVHVKTV